VYDLLAMEDDSILSEKCDQVQEWGIALNADVSTSLNINNQKATTTTPTISPEVHFTKTITDIRYDESLHYYRIDFAWQRTKSQRNKSTLHFRNYLLYQ
jgi:hypothetical protein